MFKVKVTDVFGEPIGGAIVKVKNITEWTDPNGIALFKLDPGVYNILATSEGETCDRTVNVSENEVIVMKI